MQLKMKPNLLIVSFTNIDNDVRILRHIEALSTEFEIQTVGFGKTPSKVSKHFQIPDALKYLPISAMGVVSLLTHNYERALQITQSFEFAKKIVSSEDVDVLFLNDVQTIGLAEFVEPQTSVVMDMHEYAPREMEDDWRFRVLLQGYYTSLCKKYLPLADVVVTVSDGLKTGFDELCGISAHVVRNICKYENLSPTVNKGKIRLVHSGLAAKARDLETMIEAVAKLENFTLDLFLVEAPRQRRYLNKLKKMASRTQNVQIRLPVKPEEIASNLNSYDIGLLVIPPSNFSLKHCLPNKLFDYVQARLMTICGPSPDLSAVVSSNELGMVLAGYSAAVLSDYLNGIDRQEIQEYKEKADLAAVVLSQDVEGDLLKELVMKSYEQKR